MTRPIRSLLAYLLLVVPPFCGLLAILHVGQDLEPPRSIGGSWAVDPACGVSGTLKIAQSGPRADGTLEVTHAALALELDGDHLVGSGGCRLDARVAGDALTGTVQCAACPATPFHAIRKPRTPGK